MTKDELLEENKILKEEKETIKKENETLKEEKNALEADIAALETKETAYEKNNVRLDTLISKHIKEIEEAPVMNSVMRENLESLCRARNLLGGE